MHGNLERLDARHRYPASSIGCGRLIAPLGALLLAGCTNDPEATPARHAWVEDGPPVSCISTNRIRRIGVVDSRTIDFEMTGRQMYRNSLPFSCSGLTFNQAIRHNSRTSQLCSTNCITVRAPGGGWSGATCALGRFQPMKRAPVPEAPTG